MSGHLCVKCSCNLVSRRGDLVRVASRRSQGLGRAGGNEDENNVDWLNMAPGGIQPVIKSVDEMPEYTELELSLIHI